MNTFYLVRHGKKELKRGDVHLTPKGIEQAKATGKYFKDKNIDVIYCSSYNRTKETAEEINNFLKVKLITTDKLRERANFGDVNNQSFVKFISEWYQASKNSDISKHGRHSSFEVGETVKNFILELNKKYKNKNILCVIHGGAISDFLRNVIGDNKLEKIANIKAFRTDEKVKFCSITKFIVSEDKNLKLLSFADVSHLK